MRKGGLYVAMGDSITWAVAVGATKGVDFYATKIRNAIRLNHGPVRLLNKGLGGATSTEMVQNLPWLCGGLAPDLVTIGIGTNDSASGSIPVATYEANLRTIIDFIRVRNPAVHIVLCTPPNTTEVNRTPYISAYRTAMAGIATEKNVSVCNFHTAWLEADTATYCADGIHPNAAGHQLLYNVLWPVVQASAASWLTGLGGE